MVRVGQAARFKLSDIGGDGIDHTSPLEDQATLVWRAVRKHAEVLGWSRRTLDGHSGYVGPLVMKQFVRSIFSGAMPAELNVIDGLVNQVLRKTNATRCLHNPTADDYKKNPGLAPTWWVNDVMPENIVTVAIYIREHGGKGPRTTPAKTLDLTRNEQRLSPKEAGEDRTPAPVFVEPGAKKPEPAAPAKVANLREYQRQRMAARHAIIMRVLRDATQPLTPIEISEAAAQLGGNINLSTVHSDLARLAKDGLVFSRTETKQERELRAGGPVKATPSSLWSLGDPVPPRTTREAVPGVLLSSSQETVKASHQRRDDLATKILDAVGDANHGLSRKALRAATGATDEELLHALQYLERNQLMFLNSAHQWVLEDWRTRQHSTHRGLPTSHSEPSATDPVVTVIRAAERPLRALEIHERLPDAEKRHITTLRQRLHRLVRDKQVFARTETRQECVERTGSAKVGTAAQLYWHTSPVPPLKETEVTEIVDVELPEGPQTVAIPDTDEAPPAVYAPDLVDKLDPRVRQIIDLLVAISQDAADSGKLEAVEEEVSRLRAENERLTKAVAGLQSALSALTL